jgi:putative salt-induced outer membrane protein YdiY
MHSRILFSVLVFAAVSLADQVMLKNGDRISGSVLRFDGKNVVLKSEFAGELTIPWDAVTGVTSSEPLNVGLKDGQLLVGTVQAEGGQVSVRTAEAGVVNAPRESVEFIRSKEEQAAWELEIDRFRNPRLVDLWTGFVDLGFATSRGNARTETVNVSANATRATTRDKITAHFTAITSSGRVGDLNVTTANARRGGLSYSVNLNPKWFGFGSLDIESDQFQSLDLRFVPAGGFGYHAIATPNTALDFRLGGALNREFFSTGLDRSRVEALIGETFVHKFSETSSFNQSFFYFPGISASGHRLNFDMSVVTALRRWFSWQFTVSDRYLSNPVPGRKTNDVLFTTGARLTFAK